MKSFLKSLLSKMRPEQKELDAVKITEENNTQKEVLKTDRPSKDDNSAKKLSSDELQMLIELLKKEGKLDVDKFTQLTSNLPKLDFGTKLDIRSSYVRSSDTDYGMCSR